MSTPSTVSLASWETHFARLCRETPPDERSLRSAASGGRSEQGTAPRSKISRRNAAEIFGHRKIIVCGSKRKGAIPTFSGGYHRLFPQKEMGVIYKSENISTLPPLTRSPSPDRGGFSAGSRPRPTIESAWKGGRIVSAPTVRAPISPTSRRNSSSVA